MIRLYIRLIRPPFFSVIGIIIFILAVIMKLCFIYATDIGVKILTSTLFAVLLWCSTFWGIFGFYEFFILMKACIHLRLRYTNGEIDGTIYHDKLRASTSNYIINTIYMIIVVLSSVYVVFNWEEINI
ncbi:hypothetical protein AWU65_28490 [Paenibacillus glucanolyticus]|uniref:Uncharacterized protein n=1 Tax=Paenibacillus glucanolyticus TaxID=59843 RepID=A0A163ETZ9_9BACL|nr:hypothetical protein B9D94_08370 [Paenibacillus sp. Cedars]KZS44015.1 hypothetical protein AWU65_28490 [Paenibacillus glucanolyticus]